MTTKQQWLVCSVFFIAFMTMLFIGQHVYDSRTNTETTVEETTTVERTTVAVTTKKETTEKLTTAVETTITETTTEVTTTEAQTTMAETTAYYENNAQYKKSSVSSKTLKLWGIQTEGVKIANIWLYRKNNDDAQEAYESDILVIEIASNSKDFTVSLEDGAELLESKMLWISHKCFPTTSGTTLKLKDFSEGLSQVTLSTSEWTSIIFTEDVIVNKIIFKFQ